MKPFHTAVTVNLLCVACLLISPTAHSDFELTAPDGRRVLLKDDRTWTYAPPKEAERPAAKAQSEGELLLVLDGKTSNARNCRYMVTLVNGTRYEIASLVLSYAVYRAGGIRYDTVSSGKKFNSLKPGDKQSRDVYVAGLPCEEIERLQVGGGDRCEMDDLHKYSEANGQCLKRLRVAPSKLVRFEK
jgi:hypothetical protein